MTASVLLNVLEGLKTILTATDLPDASPMFGASGERIYFQGEAVPYEDMPIAQIECDDEVATELQQTGKMMARLPVTVRVFFDDQVIPGAASLRARHTEIRQLVQDQVMSGNRDLGGPALDVYWRKGGAKLHPVVRHQGESADEDPDLWMFQITFEIDYRHRVDDSTTQA